MVQQAPFLGFVQIIVYTGAIMMLFLFVLMLVGRDASDSVVEMLRGQRVAALLLGIGFAALLVAGLLRALHGDHRPVGLAAGDGRPAATSSGIAELLFTKYLFAFELTSALLITAAIGAMVLAYAQSRGAQPSAASGPPSRRGCAASTTASPRCPARACSPPANSVAMPALLPDGSDRPRVALGDHRRHAESRTVDAARGRRARPHRRSRTDGRTRRPVSPTYYLVLSALLFTIGAVGVLVRRNAIVVFMCIELMLNAVNLALVTFSRINGHLDGQVMAFFVMVVAAAEVVVGLAIIMSIFRTRRSASRRRREPAEVLRGSPCHWLLAGRAAGGRRRPPGRPGSPGC